MYIYKYDSIRILFGVVVSKLTILMLENIKFTRHYFSNKVHMLFRLGCLAITMNHVQSHHIPYYMYHHKNNHYLSINYITNNYLALDI